MNELYAIIAGASITILDKIFIFINELQK